METNLQWNRLQLLGTKAFEPLHTVLHHMETKDFPSLEELNGWLAKCESPIRVHGGHTLRFVQQEYGKLSFERQYEPRCYLHGEVPTRERNWHDLLNALVWMAFPKTKSAINRRHYLALTTEEKPGELRGSVRDMLTLFDESGVIVPYADDSLAGLLRNHAWKELFWQRREEVIGGMDFCVFGHGLYEKTLKPYIGMTGPGLLLRVETGYFGWPLSQQIACLDERVSDYLLQPQHCRSTRELTPVPLLGVPGWWAENESEAFYDNTEYFRRARNG